MSLQVKYVDAPVGAQESAVIAASQAQPFGQAQQLKSGAADTPWATLEQRGWPLDGTRYPLWETSCELGWWSEELSGGDGRFLQPPVLTVSLSQPYTAKGLSFRFWPSLGQWCSALSVRWYLGDNLLAETAAYPDSAEWVLRKTVENFDTVEIQLLATNIPRQFAKLQQLHIGQVMVFSRDEISKVSLLKEVDPSLCRLSVDTMTVRIRDRKGRELRPQKDQAIHLYRDGVQLAAQYITDAARQTQRDYTFRCQSAVGRLEDTFMGGIYENQPIYALMKEVLGAFPFVLADGLVEKTVTGYLPVCTCRQALQQIAFAIGGAVTTLQDGRIYLAPLPEEVASYFDYNSIFMGANLRREATTAAVAVTAHSYLPSDEEVILLKGQPVDGENVLFVFSAPHYDYHSPDASCVVLDSGANWVRITGGQCVTLAAKKYHHAATVHTKTNPTATAGEKNNVVSVEKATLIHPGNVMAALERLFAFCSLNDLLTQRVIVSGQEAGQLARSSNPWGTVTEGYITRVESEFTDSGHTADITIRGREVQRL